MAHPLVADPCWLPHRLVDGGRAIRFVRVERAWHRSAAFLDDASLGANLPTRDLAAAEIVAAMAGIPSGLLHFVFHSAFACSTLLTRALDLPGLSMGLNEPAILNDLVSLVRSRSLARETLSLALALLARPFGAGETVVVKPSNVVSPLLAGLLEQRPDARALLLYPPLPAFLHSIDGKGMFGRIWARKLVDQLRDHAAFDAGFTERDLCHQTDLQAAAFGWLLQHAQFGRLAARFPGRVRVLDAPALLADKAGSLEAIGRWFGIPIDPTLAAEIAAGPVFAEDSKRRGTRFEGGATTTGGGASDEIAMVTEWIGSVAAHCGVALDIRPALHAAD